VSALALALLLCAAPAQDAPAAPAPETPARAKENEREAPQPILRAESGKTWFVMRMWPGKVVKYDPVTDEVVGVFDSGHGSGWMSQPTHDRRSILHLTRQRTLVQVIDLETMTLKDVFPFEEYSHIVRVQSVRELPGGKRWYVQLERIERKVDSYVVPNENEWVEYDLAEREIVTRMKELPKAIRRGARLSPDGTQWHVFDGDVKIIDAVSLEEVGKIELAKPMAPGMGPISIRGDDLFDLRNPAAYRFAYSMRDPVDTNRTLYGIVDLDLTNKKVSRLSEWPTVPPRVWGYERGDDPRIAVGARGASGGFGGGGGRGSGEYRDEEIMLFTIDMETGKKLKETRHTVRNGLNLTAVSPDGSKIYLAGRGNELHVFDRDHNPLKVVSLPGEIDGGVTVVRP
jgi:hypothetical protein